MKKIVFALMIAMLMPTAFAKPLPLSEDQLHRLVELDRLENKAHEDLQKAEHAALMGKISSNQLRLKRMQYDAVSKALQAELSKLPNRAEIEQWLIDNHVRVGQ